MAGYGHDRPVPMDVVGSDEAGVWARPEPGSPGASGVPGAAGSPGAEVTRFGASQPWSGHGPGSGSEMDGGPGAWSPTGLAASVGGWSAPAGQMPGPGSAGAADTSMLHVKPKVSLLGLGIAGLGLVAVIYAQTAPWGRITPRTVGPSSGSQELSADQIGSAQLFMAGLGWILLMGLVAVALVSGPPLRRLFSAAALGVAAGQLVLLVGAMEAMQRAGVEVVGRGADVSDLVRVTAGNGLYASFAGVALLAGAVVVAQLPARERRADDPIDDPEPEAAGPPADISVTPLPPGRTAR